MSPAGQPSAKLLVVEDNDVTREWTAIVLRGAGYEVILAADGAKALDLLIRAGLRPDVIILDMLMPVLDGWHFLTRLRQEGPKPPVPIIITTATILTAEWAKAHGCQGILRKPFETEPLLAEVQRCLAEARSCGPSKEV